ncbi:MAG: AAA family ATPase [Bifidobacteriaceae bacterium]|nr:AAA family ATPase [Bifidobacteriaceae bacterium]
MRVSRLVLDHYRSWKHCLVDFEPGVNVLYGRNGLGKTNIVEAVEVLATGGSHRASATVPLVERGEKTATIRANVIDGAVGGDAAYVVDGIDTANHTDASGATVSSDSAGTSASDARTTMYAVTLPVRGGNKARINGGASMPLRSVVGQVRAVVFAPDDQLLVSMDPARRRGFLDSAGVQLVPGYYETAQEFTHIAKQRAKLLRQIGQERALGHGIAPLLDGLEAWTASFIDRGLQLTQMRSQVCEALHAPFASIYERLSGGGEATMLYAPGFAEAAAVCTAPVARQDWQSAPQEGVPVLEAISGHFQRIFEGEVAQSRNLIGPHRDDVTFMLDGAPARDYASNGEMWTIALALKMALCTVLEGMPARDDAPQGAPVLILDDVFSQLDASRRAQIVEFASHKEQTLITVAAPGDVPNGVDGIGAHMIDVEKTKEDSDASAW